MLLTKQSDAFNWITIDLCTFQAHFSSLKFGLDILKYQTSLTTTSRNVKPVCHVLFFVHLWKAVCLVSVIFVQSVKCGWLYRTTFESLMNSLMSSPFFFSFMVRKLIFTWCWLYCVTLLRKTNKCTYDRINVYVISGYFYKHVRTPKTTSGLQSEQTMPATLFIQNKCVSVTIFSQKFFIMKNKKLWDVMNSAPFILF